MSCIHAYPHSHDADLYTHNKASSSSTTAAAYHTSIRALEPLPLPVHSQKRSGPSPTSHHYHEYSRIPPRRHQPQPHPNHSHPHAKAKSVSALPQRQYQLQPAAIDRLTEQRGLDTPPPAYIPRSSSSSVTATISCPSSSSTRASSQLPMSSLRHRFESDNEAPSSSCSSLSAFAIASRSSSSSIMRRSHSTRSRLHSHSHSPSPSSSVLPPTEGMSYFPPFEAMGSDPSTVSVRAGAAEHGNFQAGPSTASPGCTSHSPSDSRSPKRSHSKGRSLTSLAGIISPLWSMTMSASTSASASASSASPELNSPHPAQGPVVSLARPKASGKSANDKPNSNSRTSTLSTTLNSSTTSDALLEALNKRCAQIGSRRVLEPVSSTSAGMDMDMDERVTRSVVGSTRTMRDTVERKRRMRSEYEVEGILASVGTTQSKSKSASAGLSQAGINASASGEEDVCAVERLVTITPQPYPSSTLSTTSSSSRRNRPNLSVPLPTFPTWRFPLPSPPITSLSPDIPNLAFKVVDNPLTCSLSASASLYSSKDHSAVSSLASSPVRDRFVSAAGALSLADTYLAWRGDAEDLDAIDDGLGNHTLTASASGPMTTPSSLSLTTLLDPITPPRKRIQAPVPSYYDKHDKREYGQNVTKTSDFDNFLHASAHYDRDRKSRMDIGLDAVILHESKDDARGMYLKPRLERTVSSASTDSKETIKPGLGGRHGGARSCRSGRGVMVVDFCGTGLEQGQGGYAEIDIAGRGQGEAQGEDEGEVTPKASAFFSRGF